MSENNTTVFAAVQVCDVIGEDAVFHGLYATRQGALRACDEAVGDYLRLHRKASLVDADCGSVCTIKDGYNGSIVVRFYVHEVPVM